MLAVENPNTDKPKNILLIIDPQKDFTDSPNGPKDKGGKGSLAVPNASNDYKNIVNMLDKVKFDEIHVSLDTHTPQHIGHPSFWKQTNLEPIPASIFRLDIDDNDLITGTNILIGVVGVDQTSEITVVPSNENPKLSNYVKEYLKWFKTPENTHDQRCYIWFNHCIENTEGHEVAEPLKTKLNKMKVTYHIKGQNNLAEMYSIFKAERPVSNIDAEKLKDFIYAGGVNTLEGENAKSYDQVKMMKNLKTELNEELLKQLLGTKEKQNTVYICGEARTHCVKSSAIDLLEYVEKNDYDQQNIVFIKNASSPIYATPNDILRKMTGKLSQEKNVEFEKDENNNGFDPAEYKFVDNYVSYNAKAMTTDEIIELFKNAIVDTTPGYLKGTISSDNKKKDKPSSTSTIKTQWHLGGKRRNKTSKKSKATKKSKKSSKTTKKHRKTHRSKR